MQQPAVSVNLAKGQSCEFENFILSHTGSKDEQFNVKKTSRSALLNFSNFKEVQQEDPVKKIIEQTPISPTMNCCVMVN